MIRSIFRALLLVLQWAGQGFSQTANLQPSFDVALIRPAIRTSGQQPIRGGGPGTTDPTRFMDSNATLFSLLITAYGFKKDQISGPDWLRTKEYAVTATMAPGTTAEQFQVMLQNLLVERFGLEFHHEMKEVPVYALEVASGGPRFVKWTAAGSGPGFPLLPADVDFGYTWTNAPQWLVRAACRGCRMAEFAIHLEQHLLMRAWYDPAMTPAYRLPLVVDRTGLAGKFTFTLEFAQLLPPHAVRERGGGASLLSALEKQLGLKLEKGKKVPVDTLVIDHAEKLPSEN